MPDLLVAAAPSPQAKGSGVNSAARADVLGAQTASPSDASFAATLKSHMGKKPDTAQTERPRATDKAADKATEKAADKADKIADSAAGKAASQDAGEAPTETAANASATAQDVAKLLPMLEAALGGKRAGRASDDATDDAADNSEHPGLDAPLALAALPGVHTAALTAKPAQGDAADDALPGGRSAGWAGLAATAGAGEKLAAGTAIAADTATASHADAGRTLMPADLQSHDFQVLLDRASIVHQHGAQSSAAPTSPALPVATPLGQAAWPEEVGQKLSWMISGNRQQADLVLTPPHLGRIEVSLTVNGDQATATFASANPAVREALENSVQRLREVLADAGVSLGQTEVGAESFRQQGSRQENSDNSRLGRGGAEAIDRGGIALVTPPPTSSGRGMVDVFA